MLCAPSRDVARSAGRLRDAQPIQEVLETAAVLGHVDGLGTRPDDGHAAAGQGFTEIDGRLTAELQNRRRELTAAFVVREFLPKPGVLILQDVPHALFIQSLEVQPLLVSKSVDTVSGLEFTMMLATPASCRAQAECTLQ